MVNKLGIGNYIGIGLCIFAWVGLMPMSFKSIGASLELGIFITAITIGIGIPLLLYFKLEDKTAQ